MRDSLRTPSEPDDIWQRHLDAGEQALRQGRTSEAEQQYLDALQLADQFEVHDPRRVESLTRLGLLKMPVP
jgi:hypothetical protein